MTFTNQGIRKAILQRTAALFLILILFSTAYAKDAFENIFAESDTAENRIECYTIDKNKLLKNYENAADLSIILRKKRLDNEPSADLDLISSSSSQTIGRTFHFFECGRKDKESNATLCRNDSGESIEYFADGRSIGIHIDYLTLSDSVSPAAYELKSAGKEYIYGKKTKCDIPTKKSLQPKIPEYAKENKKLLETLKNKNMTLYTIAGNSRFAVAAGIKTTETPTAFMLKTYNGGKRWHKVNISDSCYAPGSRVIVTAKESIITLCENSITVSLDGGASWKTVYKGSGNIEKVTQIENTIFAELSDSSVMLSTDAGKSWHSTKIQKDINKLPSLYRNETDSPLPLPTLPGCEFDHESGNAVLVFSKHSCDPNALPLTLTYKKTNMRKGIAGTGWSFGFEYRLCDIKKRSLALFDPIRAEKIKYITDDKNSSLFSNTNGFSPVVKTENGYRMNCRAYDLFFDKKGLLSKLSAENVSYLMLYKNGNLEKIISEKNGKKEETLLLSKLFEGLEIKYGGSTPTKKIKLVIGSEGLLREIIYSKRKIYRFSYTFDDSELPTASLSKVEYFAENGKPKTLYLFMEAETAGGNKRNITVDMSQKNIINRIESVIYAAGTQKIASVDSLKKIFSSGMLKDATSSADLYLFEYYGNKRKKLKSTSHAGEFFGFDDRGRVNRYEKPGYSIYIEYGKYDKIVRSVINEAGKRTEYGFKYSSAPQHPLIRIRHPKGEINLDYDKNGNLIKTDTGRDIVTYEYNERKKPLRIVVKDRGEIKIEYKKGDIDKTRIVTYDKSINSNEISMTVMDTMRTLVEVNKKGTLDLFPKWIR